jgi:RimJ/RimL family protein N-acetyltransferase
VASATRTNYDYDHDHDYDCCYMTKTTSVVFPETIPTLHSKRLVLNSIGESDEQAYFELCSNLDVMRPWGTKPHQTQKETSDLIALLNDQFKKQQMIRWAIRETENGPLLGDVGFWRFVTPR